MTTPQRPSLFARLLINFSKRRYGTPIAPIRDIYTHMPLSFTIIQFTTISLFEYGLSLPKRLKILLASTTSQTNGCAFCSDLHAFEASKANIDFDTLHALQQPHEHPHLFSPDELSALQFTHALLSNTPIPPTLHDGLSTHFNRRQRIEITWTVGLITSLNLLSTGLQLASDQLCPLPARPKQP